MREKNKQSTDFVSKTVCSSLIITLFYSVILIFYGEAFYYFQFCVYFFFFLNSLFILFLFSPVVVCAFRIIFFILWLEILNDSPMYTFILFSIFFFFYISGITYKTLIRGCFRIRQFILFPDVNIVRVKTTDRYTT